MSQPTFSVVIPVYNGANTIARAIESVIAQSYPAHEIIVVDDGSTDATVKKITKFGDIVTYIRQENAGVCAARNTGIANATGDFIAFLDADDIWYPKKTEKQLEKFAVDPEVGLVHCGLREFESTSGKTIRLHRLGCEGWVAEDILLWEKQFIIGTGGSIIVRRDVIDTVGNFDIRLKNGEDWEFCLRVARKYKVAFVKGPYVDYRNHGVNAHMNVNEMERSTRIAWAKAFDTDDQRSLRLRRQSYGNLHKVLAGSYLKDRQFYGFARNVMKSLWYRPSYIAFYLKEILPGRREKGW